MRRIAIKLLEYWPFIAIYVMIVTCVVGILKRSPELKELLYYCVPIGVLALIGIMESVRAERNRVK